MQYGSGAIGVVIVAYRSDDVIVDCVESLKQSTYGKLRVVVVDNASPDASVVALKSWAIESGEAIGEYVVHHGAAPCLTGPEWLSIVRLKENLGFAGGVNVGLQVLLSCPEIELFWVLNPDCTVRPTTAERYATMAAQVGRFALMSGRTLYHDPPDRIQSDGARVNMWTGICRNLNNGLSIDKARQPNPAKIDYFVGANVVASREFIETAGLMPEEYFLYYEEVEWALRRGSLPLIACPEAVLNHRTGTSIGSKAVKNRASGFSNYFNYRNRLAFVRRNHGRALAIAYIYSWAKVVWLCMGGDWEGAQGAFCGLNGLPPPSRISERLPAACYKRAFVRRP